MTHIFVEGNHDAQIVQGVLRRLDLPTAIPVEALRRSLNPKNGKSREAVLQRAAQYHGNCIVVYDQESGTLADHPARDLEYLDLQDARVRWCAAIPQVEAWLFADELALERIVPEASKDVLSRLPSPETIPYPKMVRHYLLRSREQVDDIFDTYDLHKAAARSPSLAGFLRVVQEVEGIAPSFETAEIGSRQIDKDIVRSLISEVYPSTTTIYRTASGYAITAEEMMREVATGSEVGGEYATAILRVARDFLARQAQREKQYYPK